MKQVVPAFESILQKLVVCVRVCRGCILEYILRLGIRNDDVDEAEKRQERKKRREWNQRIKTRLIREEPKSQDRRPQLQLPMPL